MERLGTAALKGGVAGGLGTAAMTVLMEPGLAGLLPADRRPGEFVPKQIVEWLEGVAGRPGLLSEEQETGAATVAHLGYGAAMGAAYGLIRRRWGAPPPALAGAAWGLAVWALGYEGWLPAAGVRPATTDHPPRQWPVPITNHLVYGIVTALAYERIRD